MKNLVHALENIWIAVAFSEVGEYESVAEYIAGHREDLAEVKLTA